MNTPYPYPFPQYLTNPTPFAACGLAVILCGRDVVVCDSPEHADDTVQEMNRIFGACDSVALFDLFTFEA